MKKFFLFFIMAQLFLVDAHASEKIMIKVKGMVCSFCAQGLIKKFKAEPFVEDVQVTLKKKLLELTAKDNNDLTDEKLTQTIQDAGYNVEKIVRSHAK